MIEIIGTTEAWSTFGRRIMAKVGKCHCGATVVLGEFTNTCDECGRDYNMVGQQLAPYSHWGEETGETLADILGPEETG